MSKLSEKEKWKIKRKQEYLSKKEDLYYIFCEGEKTEPLYFNGFKQMIELSPIYHNMILIEIYPCGAETLGILSQAEDFVQKNHINRGQIWCVYDKDSFEPNRFNAVVERIDSLNKDNTQIHYHAAWSNECIEYWFLLHFAYYRANNSRPKYMEFLTKRFKKLGYEKYVKNSPYTFDILLREGNPKMAVFYAKKIMAENEGKAPSQIAPGTKVYELVEELAQYLPEKEKNKFI